MSMINAFKIKWMDVWVELFKYIFSIVTLSLSPNHLKKATSTVKYAATSIMLLEHNSWAYLAIKKNK